MERKTITQKIDLKKGISDCSNLKDIKSLVEELISIYGEKAVINFDSGYNSISEQVVLVREETDLEFFERKSKHEASLLKKRKKIQEQLKNIDKEILKKN